MGALLILTCGGRSEGCSHRRCQSCPRPTLEHSVTLTHSSSLLRQSLTTTQLQTIWSLQAASRWIVVRPGLDR